MTKNIYAAIAAFQNECPTILKDTEGYGYKYAELSAIIEQIKPLLLKHSLGYVQRIVNNNLVTEVFHIESGEKISSIQEIPDENLKGMNKYQVIGSAITYLRRYHLSAMLGIVTDKDTDAIGEPVDNKPQSKQQQQANDKQWLNKGTEAFAKAKEWIAGGGDISQIKEKYKLSKEVENLLTQK